MKREYTRPQVLIENYILSETVTACGDVSYVDYGNNMSISDAIAALNAMSNLFVASYSCGTNVSENPEALDGTGLCYHGPVESQHGAVFGFNS